MSNKMSDGQCTSPTPRVYGLKQLYPDSNDEAATLEKKIDIIVLHGLAAQSPTTWVAWRIDGDPQSGEVNWLSDGDMLPARIPEARIMTYDWNADYDKAASSDNFLGHADTLLDRVHTNRSIKKRLERPIIFVASCFGGLLLAQAIVRATSDNNPRRSQNNATLRFVVGTFFLGTPFNGSWEAGYTAAQLRLAVADASGVEWSRELVQYMQPTTAGQPSPLDEMVREFSNFIHRHPLRFTVVCFYETRHTAFSAALRRLPTSFEQTKIIETNHGIVVTKGSASLDGVEAVGLDVRHNMLHKFNSPENDGFQRLSQRLRDLTDRSHEILELKGIDQNGASHSWPRYQNQRPALSSRLLRRDDIPPCLMSGGVIWHPKSKVEVMKVVVYGLAGVGKSQICLQSLADNEHKFESVFYIDASNRASANANYMQISQICPIRSSWEGVDLTERFSATRAWLIRRHKPWLLMIDNADSSDVSLGDYIPERGLGVVIITTTDERLAIPSQVYCKVEPMDIEHAKKLLLSYKRPEIVLCEDECKAADALVAEDLGGLPLAIAQAGSYIFNRRCTYTEYRREYGISPSVALDYMSEPRQWSSVAQTVWKTFTITIRQIQNLSEEGAVEAVELLRLLSFLHHEGVRQSIFYMAWTNMQRFCLWAQRMSLLNPSSSRWDTPKIQAAIEILCRYSLISCKSPHAGEYSVHKLVHTICRESLSKSEQAKYSTHAVSLLAVAIAAIQTPLSWIPNPSWLELERSLLPHIRSAVRGNITSMLQDHDPHGMEITAAMVLRLAKACSATGSFQDSLWITTDIHEVLTKKFGKKPTKSIAIQTMELLAESEAQLRNHHRALEIRICLHEQLVQHSTSEENICVAMMNLADSQWMTGLKEEALETATEVMKRRESSLSPNDHRLLRTMRKVAEYLHGSHQRLEALKLREKILLQAEMNKEMTPIEKVDFLATQSAMADSYQWYGPLSEALRLRHNVFTERREILGREHPDTLLACDRLLSTSSSLAQNRRKLQNICRTREVLVETWKLVCGDDHPYTLEAKANLGRCYAKIGHKTRALEVQEDVLEIRKRDFEKHKTLLNCTSYLSSMVNVATLLERLRRPSSELNMRERALLVASQNEDLVDQQFMLKFNNDCLLRYITSENDEVLDEKVAERVKLLTTQHHGAERSAPFRSESLLALNFENLGANNNAICIREKLLEEQCNLLGEDKSSSLRNMKRLASLLANNADGENSSQDSRLNRAMKLMEQVEEVESKRLGGDHFRTTRTRTKLLNLYNNLGETEKAQELSKVMEQKTQGTHSHKFHLSARLSFTSGSCSMTSKSNGDGSTDDNTFRSWLLSSNEDNSTPSETHFPGRSEQSGESSLSSSDSGSASDSSSGLKSEYEQAGHSQKPSFTPEGPEESIPPQKSIVISRPSSPSSRRPSQTSPCLRKASKQPYSAQNTFSQTLAGRTRCDIKSAKTTSNGATNVLQRFRKFFVRTFDKLRRRKT